MKVLCLNGEFNVLLEVNDVDESNVENVVEAIFDNEDVVERLYYCFGGQLCLVIIR